MKSSVKTDKPSLQISFRYEQSCQTVTSKQLSHYQIRCGTRAAARRTSPTNTQSCETPCRQSHLLLSTPGLTPRLERSPWRWRVCWPPMAVCTVKGGETTRRSLETQRLRRVRRPTKCTKRRQPLTATTTEQPHQSTQVTTLCDTCVPPQNICGKNELGCKDSKPYLQCLHRRRGRAVLKNGRFTLVQLS